jgi:hypothetical protein
VAETASQTDNMFGDKLYQVRARQALPILVRQALSRKPIFYEALAAELGMPNPRNLNYVLGSIGTTLNELASDPELGEIPHIQSLVINQQRRLPGEGFEGFLAQRMKEYQKLSLAEKRAYLDAYWHEVYAYPYWRDVLEACNLAPATNDAASIVAKAKTGKSGGGGEGEDHRRLKEYVAANPSIVGLPSNLSPGTTEAPLPSGDKIDVLFDGQKRLVAVEVKSKISNEVDLARGLFQCVKYRAVMEAERGFKGARYSIEAMLVVGKPFPESLCSLQNSLAVQVIEVLDHS